MEINKEIIERYHLGLCNLKEIKAVEAWLESDQVDMTFPEDHELRQLENSGWEKLTKRYDLPASEVETPSIDPKIKRFGLSWQIAAGIAVILGLGIAYLFFNSTRPDQKEINNQLSYQEIHTAKGQKLSIKLPDGTQVWINSESTLRFPRQFGQNQRAVNFTGEGYFKVAKNPKKPFIITSGRTKTQVLGTRFNLRDYPDEQLSSVIVEEGKVRFSGLNSPDNLVLTANQKGTYASNILTQQQIYNTGKYIDWKDNKLILDNLTLRETAAVLERWYGVKLTITNAKLSQKRYTGSFENPGLKQVIESICFALNCSYKQQENTWTISK